MYLCMTLFENMKHRLYSITNWVIFSTTKILNYNLPGILLRQKIWHWLCFNAFLTYTTRISIDLKLFFQSATMRSEVPLKKITVWFWDEESSSISQIFPAQAKYFHACAEIQKNVRGLYVMCLSEFIKKITCYKQAIVLEKPIQIYVLISVWKSLYGCNTIILE